ncbi:MAG: 4Fe-4S dicluster domain-containing protein [Candidatus Portnoybacteria bacterium]|nr:4Fe-4S dicluster domain-containing protein [Candidatus Portnoybacteria bacterium]
MALIIEKKQIKDWLGELKKDFKVVDTKKAVLPIKQYFLPPRQEIFVFDKKNQRLTALTDQKNLVIFCYYLDQLEAMTQLDEIMKKPQPDFFYWQKRDQATLVGLIDESVEVAPGGDIILEKINPRQYRVLVLTEKGKKISKNEFFKEVAKPQIKKYPAEPNLGKKMLLDSELLAEAVAWSINHKIWDELAKKCLGCGICTYVCPLCHCFSIKDRVSLTGTECTRCRQWDACTLPGFARIAGGHNFHPTIKERYYNWFYHKFVRAYKEYGKAQCVACGRCKEYCPAGIEIGEVLREIVMDYKARDCP